MGLGRRRRAARGFDRAGVSATGSAGARGGSGCAAVLMYETAEDVDSFDPSGRARWCAHLGWSGRRSGYVEVDASVWTGWVVVRQVRGEDPVQVAVVADQDPVQAFGANGAHPAFGVGVRPGRPWWDLECLDAGCGDHRVACRGELGVAVAGE